MEEALRDGEIALSLGSGKHKWPGWVHVDFNEQADFQCDLRKLPFQDNYADRMVAIHVFEHFYFWETRDLLTEWKRVLKPGGSLVLELPNMERVLNHIFLRMKKGEKPSPGFSWLAIWGDPSYKDPAMAHKWGYFRSDMDTVLAQAGFENAVHEEARYHFPQRDMRVTAFKPQPLARNR